MRSVVGGTLGRYFAFQFLTAVLAVFAGVFALVALVDYIELMRRNSEVADLSALMVAQTSIYRVPQVTERILPFAVLIGAMSCYLGLSRRLELVIARAAGMSAWQFIAPAVVVALLLGAAATALYNPLAAYLNERSQALEARFTGGQQQCPAVLRRGFWVRQRSIEGQSIINAATAPRTRAVRLGGITAFVFDRAAVSSSGSRPRPARWSPAIGGWKSVRRLSGRRPAHRARIRTSCRTNLTPEQVRETFSTPETVPFWELPHYIRLAENAGLAAAGYRLQYQKLLSRPFMLARWCFWRRHSACGSSASAASRRWFWVALRQGFLLYVMSKVTDDLSKAELLHPVTAAWLPVLVGGMTGFIALLYLEDG